MQSLDDAMDLKNQASLELGAWLLPIGQDQFVSVGRYELKHLEYIGKLVSLPGLPAFCERGFLWREKFIPAVEIQSLVARKRITVSDSEQLAAIVAYEDIDGEILLGAILLQGVPKLISVNPSQSVSLYELSEKFRRLAQAAFKDNDEVYPVLNLSCLFDKSPADLLSLH